MDILPFFFHTFTTPNLSLLFILSFLAATILPIGSEWLLITMVLQGFSLDKVVIIATLGNYLGALTTYMIGIWGAEYLIRRILRIGDTQLVRAKKLYGMYGLWSLLLSWLPVIGDPLCLIAGVFRIGFFRFSVLVFVGKFCRYAILGLLVHYGTGG
jgi:membrane protein YqaA with SNARE-associated domain